MLHATHSLEDDDDNFDDSPSPVKAPLPYQPPTKQTSASASNSLLKALYGSALEQTSKLGAGSTLRKTGTEVALDDENYRTNSNVLGTSVQAAVDAAAHRSAVAGEIDFDQLKVEHEAKKQAYMNRNIKRAAKLLPKIKFFTDLESTMPGFMSSMTYICRFQKLPEGTVVFRQKDVGAHLFYVIKGEVGVFINNNKPRTPQYAKPESLDKLTPSKYTASYWLEAAGLKRKSRKLQDALEQDQKNFERLRRYPTFEMFSTWSHASDFGKQVAVLGTGKSFGDMALRNDDRRNATITCLTDCEFLCVHKDDFEVKLCEKVCHFKACVPGFQKYEHHGPPQTHPAAKFKDMTYNKGIVLLEEGIKPWPTIFCIRSGTVAFRRAAAFNWAQDGGLAETSGWSERKRQRTWLKMGVGETFCTFGMLSAGLGEESPYTVTVTSDKCVVYILSFEDLAGFQVISRYIMEEMIEGIREALKPLLHLFGSFSGLDAVQGAKQGWKGKMKDVHDCHFGMSKRPLKYLPDVQQEKALSTRSEGQGVNARKDGRWGTGKYKYAPSIPSLKDSRIWLLPNAPQVDAIVTDL